MEATVNGVEENVGVHVVVLGDMVEVVGHFDSRNKVVTCAKRVCGLASSEDLRRESRLSCHEGGHRG